MTDTFPFGFPTETARYLALYVLTFALHQSLMHYVLAGSAFVALAMIFPGRGDVPRGDRPPAAVLRDWMPFMLSAAITAGVAPLLFVQILYQREFYSANLLLAWRWVIVIPVLIVGFYFLYVSKSFAISKWMWLLRTGLTVATALMFVFVGFCWTANFLLGISEAEWPEVYISGRMPFTVGEVALRMAVWFGAALASMATILAWQLTWWRASYSETEVDSSDVRSLSLLAIIGTLVATICGGMYIDRSQPVVSEMIMGEMGRAYLGLGVIGSIAVLAGWFAQWLWGKFSTGFLSLATIGWLIALVSGSVLREIGRVATLDMDKLETRHQAAAGVGGLNVFLTFAIVNLFAISVCIWLARRGRVKPS